MAASQKRGTAKEGRIATPRKNRAAPLGLARQGLTRRGAGLLNLVRREGNTLWDHTDGLLAQPAACREQHGVSKEVPSSHSGG